jgi:Polyketide cyclase / dehydrase and lipid transport
MMSATATLESIHLSDDVSSWDEQGHCSLLDGEILVKTQPHSAWGGAVTALMYLPSQRSHVWQQLTNYSRWVHYFPDMIRSEIIDAGSSRSKRLHQVAQKAFLMFTAKVEIYLRVFEISHQNMGNQIQFCLEHGDFADFAANLKLQDYSEGTLLTYTVRATPTIPVPSTLIQQAMRLDLPTNLRTMRRVICDRV